MIFLVQEMEAQCFAASASKAVYLGRLASAVRAAGQTSSEKIRISEKTDSLSQSPPDCSTSKGSAEAVEADLELRDASGMAGSAVLGQAIARLEELQPFGGGRIAEAFEWLEKLKGLSVTAEMLKENAVGKRLRAIAKSKHSAVAGQANAVVAEWKAQLLKA